MNENNKNYEDANQYVPTPNSFNDILPRTILTAGFTELDPNRTDKTAQTFTGIQGLAGVLGQSNAYSSAGSNILRNPHRRFYDPEITTTAIYLPRTIKQKNRWCRWFYDHDELVGPVLDTHAELPYSKAELKMPRNLKEDPSIIRHIEEAFDKTNFFSMLPIIDLEFMKVGEVFIHTPWDDSKGLWSHIIVHNPDFVEVNFTPFADQECVIELIPDDELKALVHSTKPENQQLKKRIPEKIFRKVLTGKNITLEPEEVTHVARRSNPYDIRGTSIIGRLFRLLMYEDKLREAQITIADNFVYPLKIFKLGDPKKGWIPNETHQRALAQMLQQSTFDPNFSLIYHYGLQVDYVTVADKVMRLEKEWSDISERKMIALGVGKQFLSGETGYASANVSLQIQLARYKAKRDLFDLKFIREKFLKIMAEKNEWYERDKKELVGQYRISRKGREKEERLIVPELLWHKKLMMRDDQAFLTFLNNVYAQGKGPLSAITLLQYMGLSLDDELSNKQRQKKLEEKIGALTHPSVAGPTGLGGMGMAAPMAGAASVGTPAKTLAKVKNVFTRKKGKIENSTNIQEEGILTEDAINDLDNEAKDFTGKAGTLQKHDVISPKESEEVESKFKIETAKVYHLIDDDTWFNNLESPNVPSEIKMSLIGLNNKLNAIGKKNDNNYREGLLSEKDGIIKILDTIYHQGKLFSYGITEYYSMQQDYYASDASAEYSDLLMKQEFEEWLDALITEQRFNSNELYQYIRRLGNTCFCYGQLKGLQEQGIYNIKIGNVFINDGLRYQTKELLRKSYNLSHLISPKDEIIILYPCIEGFDDEEYFDNKVDPLLKRYKDFVVGSISVNNCPIEYVQPITMYLNRVGKYIKSKWDTISFVKDVVELEDWTKDQISVLQKQTTNTDTDQEAKNLIIANMLSLKKIQKQGTIPVFPYKKTLYISNWIGMEDTSIINNLLKHIDIVDDSLKKQIQKVFVKSNFDLSEEEIQTYTIFNHILPLTDSSDNLKGYILNEQFINNPKIDSKLKQGQVWNTNGKCTYELQKNELQIFKENLKLWINYPHMLDSTIKKYFEEL